MPLLDPEQLRRLAYGGADWGENKQQRSRELANVRAMLRQHEREGRTVIETDGPCWRILETWTARLSGLPC